PASLFSPYPLSFTHTATPTIYPLSLHDALPIFPGTSRLDAMPPNIPPRGGSHRRPTLLRFETAWTMDVCTRDTEDLRNSQSEPRDRKSTRLNSSHSQISYAVFCLKKKKTKNNIT